MRYSFNIEREIKKQAKKFYTPDAVKIPFKNVGDEAKYNQRLATDPQYALKRKYKGIHAGEGLTQDVVPTLGQINKKRDPLTSTSQASTHSFIVNDPVERQAKAEQAFDQYKVAQGYDVMRQGQGPQTAADSLNIQAAQDHQQLNQNSTQSNPFLNSVPYQDTFKKQEQDFSNPFAPGNGAPNNM